MPRSKLLITGSSSLVGSHFVESYASKYSMFAIGRRNTFGESGLLSSFETVDLRDELKLKKAIMSSDATVVINYAAETNVDECEKEYGDRNGNTYRLNTQAVIWIAEACKETGKKLFHISTDFVFDGTKGPYSEFDEAGEVNSRIGWYGYTKYLSEVELAKILPQANYCIMRISYPYRHEFLFKTDFARNLLNLYREGKLFPLFTDQTFTPTFIDDASSAMDFLIQRNSSGIFHVACKNLTNPFDFGCKLVSTFFSIKEPESILRKSSVIEFNKKSRSPRPICGGLKTDKIQGEGFILKTYERGIQTMFEQTKSR